MLAFVTKAPAAKNAPIKLGKRKPDPERFWAGFLTLIAGSLNSRVQKLTVIITNTKMLDVAANPGFGAEEKEKAVEESDSDSDYARDTDEEEMALLETDAEEA